MLLPNPKGVKPKPAFAFERAFALRARLRAAFLQRPFFSRLNRSDSATVATSTVATSTVATDDHDTATDKQRQLALVDLKRHVILGAGSFGQVQLVSEELPDGTRRPYALKVQTKKNDKNEDKVVDIVQELTIMKKLSHPFLINLVNDFQDDKNVYFLLPLLQGGDLSDRLTMLQSASGDSDGKKTPQGLSEDHAKFYAFCIADALAYLHSQGCVHRDLKPDNVMIDNLGYPVVVDFGLAVMLEPGETAHDRECGTRHYMAYEVVYPRNSGYGCSVDHWSFGALVYELVTGHNLYYNMRKKEKWQSRLKSIVKGNIKFPKGVSDNFMDLIRKLLVKDPTLRLGSLEGGEQDILDHPWFDGLDIVSLRQRKFSNVPWVPTIHDPLDTSNFTESRPLLG